MSYNTIDDFNVYLLNNLTNLTLGDYFKQIHSQFYSDIDISFMEFFLELCEHENEFIIEHSKLKEYNVITNIKSCNILDCLLKFDLIENQDYRVLNVQQPVKQGGYSIKNLYTLTPYAFKFCLIRSRNTKEYTKYYLLLEQIFKNYQEYQKMYKDKLLLGKDTKIDKLQDDLNK